MNQAHTRKLYNRLAADYNTKWGDYLRSTHEVAVQLVNPNLDDRILDASGGTGLLAEKMAKCVGEKGNVVLTDISEEMLRVAGESLKGYPNIEIMLNDVHDLPFDSESFSKVSSVNALHHYADSYKAVSEFYRVLKPKGSLVIVDWCRDPIRFKIYDRIMRLTSGYRANVHTSKELKQLIIKAGFKIDDVTIWSYHLWPLMGIKAAK